MNRPVAPAVATVATVVWAVVLLALALPRPAHAHHVVSEHGIAPILPRTIATLDVAATGFAAGGRTGDWQAMTPSLEWRALARLSLFAALPLGRVRLDGGDSRVGVGDLATSAKVAVFATPHGGFLLSAGLGVEWPTGDADTGFGGGHVELAPFVGLASTFFERGSFALVGYGLTSFLLSLGGGDHHHGAGAAPHARSHGSVFAPHGDRELHGRVMLAAVPGAFHLGVGGEGAAGLHGEAGHLGLRSELGWMASAGLRLIVGADVTVRGEQRHRVRGRAGAAWLF